MSYIGSDIRYRAVVLLPLEWTSSVGPKYEWTRVTPQESTADWPPSPPMTSVQFGEPVAAHVPLSCVPPSRSPVGFLVLKLSYWNCSVAGPGLSEFSWVGMRLSSSWQNVR